MHNLFLKRGKVQEGPREVQHEISLCSIWAADTAMLRAVGIVAVLLERVDEHKEQIWTGLAARVIEKGGTGLD